MIKIWLGLHRHYPSATPDLEGKVDLNLDLRPFFSIQGTAVRTSSKVGFETEFLAMASLLVVTFLCAKGLRETP